ncbi:carbohydrate ABC transporter permease [Usitatibacter palustris]|uniref:L-arabinose transport system permease protein AraQ n=1 Tax=Usitatibacter palustris TaxID=2732487 RepID=A0A6M4H8V9_9PROT|nr:carbohydrate ABC transporter permease [Usitatibacter palustris]QJR15238.1 L-arabinose transport system permease protein AraQ [Usitatibacter palustris]
MTEAGVTAPVPVGAFLTRKRGGIRADWTDWLTYAYLSLGAVVMLAPVLWVAISSFKSEANLLEFPPTLVPESFESVQVDGYKRPLTLFKVTKEDGSVVTLAQVSRVGIEATMIDPAKPEAGRMTVPIERAQPIRKYHIAVENYRQLIASAGGKIGSSIYNTVFITVVATLITLVMNSMAAFSLSIYRFPGSSVALMLILATLMVPATVVLVPIYLIVSELGLANTPWGIILPVISTPTGVFLLRQYMLTLPSELIEAARMDHASEWRIYWKVVLPLCTPALAVVAIFSIMSRWNEFLLPLIILTEPGSQTLQLALAGYTDENGIHYGMLLAMTTLTALPLALAFIFLQRYITTGIASTGIK